MEELGEQRRLKVFICYATEDEEPTEILYREMQILGFNPFLDSKKDYPGLNLDYFISEEMESADAVVMCLSETSVKKVGYVQTEVKKALRLFERHPSSDVYLVPVLLNNCQIPRELKETRITYQELYEEDGLEKLICALNVRARQLEKTPATYKGLSDMPAKMLVKLVGNVSSDRSVSILREICKKIRKGEIPVDVLAGFNKHPYWLVRRIAIENIIASGAANTLYLLFEFRTVRYWLSQDLIRKWISKRLESVPISSSEISKMEELIISLSSVEKISDQTREKDLKILAEVKRHIMS